MTPLTRPTPTPVAQRVTPMAPGDVETFPADRVTTDETGTTFFWSGETLYRHIVDAGRFWWNSSAALRPQFEGAGFFVHVAPRGAITIGVDKRGQGRDGQGRRVGIVGPHRPVPQANIALDDAFLARGIPQAELPARNRRLTLTRSENALPQLLRAWQYQLGTALHEAVVSGAAPGRRPEYSAEVAAVVVSMHREVRAFLDDAALAVAARTEGRLEVYNLVAGRPHLRDVVEQIPDELRRWPELIALEACVDPATGDLRRGLRLPTLAAVVVDAAGMVTPQRLVRSTHVPVTVGTAFREPDPPCAGWTAIPTLGRGTMAFLAHWSAEREKERAASGRTGWGGDRKALVARALVHESALASVGLDRVTHDVAWVGLYTLLESNNSAVVADYLRDPDAAIARMLDAASAAYRVEREHYTHPSTQVRGLAQMDRRWREARNASPENHDAFARAQSVARWIELADDWHVALRRQALANRLADAVGFPGPYPSLDVVSRTGATFHLTPLLSGEALAREGIAMSHCLGTRDHLEAASAGKAFYVRLDHKDRVGRGDEPDGDPYRASLELDADGSIVQVYGYGDAELLPLVHAALEADLDALLVARGAVARDPAAPTPRAPPTRSPLATRGQLWAAGPAAVW